MPELAELRFTADYINEATQGLRFTRIEKNPTHKGEPIQSPFKSFGIAAESRGKELVVVLKDKDSDRFLPIRMTMGMSGYFKLTNTEQVPKHAHLVFYSTDGVALSFIDVRRFGKWKKGLWWSDDRGPDPTTQYDQFFLNVMTNLTRPAFKKPLYEVLMNQKYFNGIGNYLRAEILYRLPEVNPFLPAGMMIAQHPAILQLCKDIPLLAYKMGGGSIRDWDNPFGEEITQENFMLCYGNAAMSNRVDSNGRRFWYDPKWDAEIETHI